MYCTLSKPSISRISFILPYCAYLKNDVNKCDKLPIEKITFIINIYLSKKKIATLVWQNE